MKTAANYMVVMFMVMFWLFRVVVAYMAGVGKSFMVSPINQVVEIVILFISLICIALVIKRKLLGGFIYLVANFGYYGVYLYNSVMPIIQGNQVTVTNGLNAFISLAAVILSIVVVMDLLSDKTKKPADKSTEWFYANKDLDRNLDDRADKNQYKTL